MKFKLFDDLRRQDFDHCALSLLMIVCLIENVLFAPFDLCIRMFNAFICAQNLMSRTALEGVY